MGILPVLKQALASGSIRQHTDISISVPIISRPSQRTNHSPIGDPMFDHSSHLTDMPGHLIRRLQQIASALFLEQAKAFEFTPVQYAALVAIRKHPGLDQISLCNEIALDRSTIGDVVGRLEKRGLINRTNGAADRRTKSLHITAAGSRMIRDIEPAVEATQRLILAPLKANERSAFMQMLKHLVHLNNEHSRAPLRPREMGSKTGARGRMSTTQAPRQSRRQRARR
jgi:MarR family transcriptional regulator, lower aerobic nicotinate degradation pathway regulator